MRADKALMLGVVGVGLYAAYKLVTAKPNDPSREPPVFAPTNPQDNRVDVALPVTAGMPDPPPANLNVLAGPALPLRGGAYYKGRIETDPRATNGQIQALVASTFGVDPNAVQVFRLASDALASPNAIGQPWATARPGQGTRWIRFRVGALDSGTRQRPPWLVVLWQAAAPT